MASVVIYRRKGDVVVGGRFGLPVDVWILSVVLLLSVGPDSSFTKDESDSDRYSS